MDHPVCHDAEKEEVDPILRTIFRPPTFASRDSGLRVDWLVVALPS